MRVPLITERANTNAYATDLRSDFRLGLETKGQSHAPVQVNRIFASAITSTSIFDDAKQAIEQQVDPAFEALCTTTSSEPDH